MKKWIAVFAAMLVLGIGTGATYAYLFTENEVINEISAADTTIDIVEEFDPPGVVKPGTVIKKDVRVASSSDQPCFVRVRVHFSDLEMEKACEPLQILEGWEMGNDGYYYCMEKLLPGETTKPLFQEVRVREETSQNEIREFEILVYAEAVSSERETMEEAWTEMDQPLTAKKQEGGEPVL